MLQNTFQMQQGQYDLIRFYKKLSLFSYLNVLLIYIFIYSSNPTQSYFKEDSNFAVRYDLLNQAYFRKLLIKTRVFDQ